MSTEAPTAVGGATTTVAPSGYPINVEADHPVNPSRFFAIPLLGIVARYVLLIPHLIALYILGFLAEIIYIVAWIPVLFTGKYPAGMYGLTAGYLGWSARVFGYMVGLSDKYPPFSLDNDASYPVRATLERPEQSSRFFAFPLVGFIARCVLLIPHIVVLYLVIAVAVLLNLVAWIPVLFGGSYPSWQYSFQTGAIRWFTRVYAYFFGLTDRYPPFRLGA